MSARALHTVLENLGYGGDSLSIYWDFTRYQTGAETRMLNDALLDQQYSATIRAANQLSIDEFTGILGTGMFEGGFEGRWAYPVFDSTSGLSASEFTLLFAGGIKDSDGELNEFGPASIKNVILSNLYGCATGFEVGLNTVNTAYFEYDNGTAHVISATGMPMARNVWGLAVRNGSITLGRYDHYSDRFEAVTSSAAFTTGDNEWVLGSGLDSTLPYSSSDQATGVGAIRQFYGQLSRIVWINSYVGSDDIPTIAKATFADATLMTGDVSEVGDYILTGELSSTGLPSEVVGREVTVSGSGVDEIVYWSGIEELTGNVTIGDTYYVIDSYASGLGVEYMYGSLPLYAERYNTGEVATGITGFEVVQMSGVNSLIDGGARSSSDVTGEGEGGYIEPTGLFGGEQNTGEMSWNVGNAEWNELFYPNSATYIGPKRTEDYGLFEYFMLTGDIGSHNKVAKIVSSRFFPSLAHVLDGTYPPSGVNLFLNRLAQTTSFSVNVQTTTVPVLVPTTGGQYVMYSCEGNQIIEETGVEILLATNSHTNYYISGVDYALTGREIMYATDYNDRDAFEAIYDVGYDSVAMNTGILGCETGVVVNPMELRLVVNTSDVDVWMSGIIDTNPARFGDVFEGNPSYALCVQDFTNSQIFLNGKKLISGVDYTMDEGYVEPYGEFVALDPITGQSGVLAFFPKLKGDRGTGLEDCAPNFAYASTSKHSLVVYVGRERISPSEIFYHSANHDMVFDTGINSEHYWFDYTGLDEI